MKKIGIIFPFARENGACRVPCIHSQMFVDAGYVVDLIVRDDYTVFPYAGNLVNLNIKSRKGMFKLLTYLELYMKVRELKKSRNYDIVISHIPHCDLINILTKRNELTITTVHINNTRRYSRISNILLKYIIKLSDIVVTVSQTLRDQLVCTYKVEANKIQCIYNPIDIEGIERISQIDLPEHLNNKKYLLNVGRLDRQKGQWHLLKSFSMLLQHETFSDYSLVIVGDGPEKDHLYQMCSDLKIKGKVYFEGFQLNPYKYMKAAELFLFPSLYEGFPIVLLEAMACKVPIISTDCQTGPAELIGKDGKFGVLIPDFANETGLGTSIITAGDHMLYDSILAGLTDRKKMQWMADNAYNKVQSYSMAHIMEKWEKIFRSKNGE